MIAEAALQEDVDVVGLSILSGAHNVLVPQVIQKLREVGKGDVFIFVGGIIPQADIPGLLQAGVKKVYGPGTDTREVCQDIRAAIAERQQA